MAASLPHLNGPLETLLACRAARRVSDGEIELFPTQEEAVSGGVALINVNRAIYCRNCARVKDPDCLRCNGAGQYVERISVYVKLPPNAAPGEELTASIEPFRFVEPLRFRVGTRNPEAFSRRA
jgi:DnaJ-class molecular chaperone